MRFLGYPQKGVNDSGVGSAQQPQQPEDRNGDSPDVRIWRGHGRSLVSACGPGRLAGSADQLDVGDRKRPPPSPQEGWLSDGRLEVTFGEVMASGEPPLLQAQPSAQRWRREDRTHEQAIKLRAQKRQQGWPPCAPQWLPSPSPAER
jgi:hypothetical protein